jgi:hypothetical protein
LGRFKYVHGSLPYYSFGIRSVFITAKQVALVATPEKALCDKVVITSGLLLRSATQVRQFLLDDLRIDEDSLRKLDLNQMSAWIEDAPKKTSLRLLVKTINDL